MTAGDDRISSSGRKRLRRGCFFFIVVFAIGFYAGLAATKRALTGPDWIKRIAGLPQPPPLQPAPPAQNPQVPNNSLPQYSNTNTNTNTNPPVSNPGPPASAETGLSTGNVGPSPGTAGPNPLGNTVNPQPAHPAPPQAPPPGGWLVGDWEITDELHPTGSQSSSVTSQYLFEDGGTGEFDTNGKKLYDIHWEDAGDYIQITFVTDTDGEQNLKVKMKYSISPDHNLLTMAPIGKKDPRGEMYSVGPGVYHRSK